MKNILQMTVLLGLIIVGLTACSEDPRMNPDQIITEESFNEAMLKQCDESWRCVRREVTTPKVEKHCSQNKFTSDQCAEFNMKVEVKTLEYQEKRAAMMKDLRRRVENLLEEVKDQKLQEERRANSR